MKQLRFKLYTLDMKYVRNLAKADNNVMSVSPQTEKSSRPFIGVLILLNGKNIVFRYRRPKRNLGARKTVLIL